jgi:hypothetical protein
MAVLSGWTELKARAWMRIFYHRQRGVFHGSTVPFQLGSDGACFVKTDGIDARCFIYYLGIAQKMPRLERNET